jgi:hypothetical protein
MPQMKRRDDGAVLSNRKSMEEKKLTEEECEDHMDYCAAVESIDETLEKGGTKKTRDFAEELGFDF